MGTGSTAEGWHVARGETQMGPYTWEQLYGFAQAGHVVPTDLVWHETRTDWARADTIPGLFARSAPVVQAPVTQTLYPQTPYVPAVQGGGPPAGFQPATAAAPRRRGWLIPVVIIAALVVIAGGVLAGVLLLRDGGSTGGDFSSDSTGGSSPGLGAASYTPPTPADLVETQAWGNVPINQIGVVLADGADRGDAEKVAQELGGTIVGEMEFINLYQVQVPSTSEAELAAILERAKAASGVELAFPNQELGNEEEIWGVRVSPLSDPVYEGENGKPYAMIGVQRAWDLVRGASKQLGKVKVGVIDSGLYRDQGEFFGNVNISTSEAGDELGAAENDGNGNTKPNGGHGTAVAGIIGADPSNGGQTGVASVLGDNLEMSMTNLWGPVYGTNSPAAADPNDPTKATLQNGQTYSIGGLRALQKQVDSGATIINCSWGTKNPPGDPLLAAAYRKFFEKMSREKPDVLFVCAAGNNGQAQAGNGFWPAGANLPNMITVGNLDNDGSKWQSSNTNGADFEVTLGAPGHRVVSGVGVGGTVANEWGGTSFATPQVTAAAAMMRSLNPDLTAAQIKEILTQTAGPGVTDDAGQASVPFPHDELGAGVLRVDLAIAKVLYDLENGTSGPVDDAVLEAFIEEQQKLGVIDAVAMTTDDPQTYDVRGIVEAVGDTGTDVSIALSGQGAIGGSESQPLAAAGEVTWTVSVLDQKAVITVRRTDNGAASIITLESIDLNGSWAGTFTIGSITFPPGAAEELEAEGCDLSVLKALEGQSMPMTLDIVADFGGTGYATVFLDSSGLSEDASSEPITAPITWSGNGFTMDISESGASGSFKGRASRQGDTDTITGTFTSSQEGVTMTGSWTVARQ